MNGESNSNCCKNRARIQLKLKKNMNFMLLNELFIIRATTSLEIERWMISCGYDSGHTDEANSLCYCNIFIDRRCGVEVFVFSGLLFARKSIYECIVNEI